MLMNLIFPKSSPSNSKHKNRLADIDHLLGHRLHRRDLFVTREIAILAQATALADKFGINVGSPEEALRQVRDAK